MTLSPQTLAQVIRDVRRQIAMGSTVVWLRDWDAETLVKAASRRKKK